MLNGKSRRRAGDSGRSGTVRSTPGKLAIVRLVLGFVNRLGQGPAGTNSRQI